MDSSLMKQPCRLSSIQVLLCKETGEMRPEYIFGCVALNPRRAGVPGLHKTFRIQEEDGIIENGLHDGPKLLIVLPSIRRGNHSFRGIADDDQDSWARGGFHRERFELDRKSRAILAPSDQI
jgi:hypothetical protein